MRGSGAVERAQRDDTRAAAAAARRGAAAAHVANMMEHWRKSPHQQQQQQRRGPARTATSRRGLDSTHCTTTTRDAWCSGSVTTWRRRRGRPRPPVGHSAVRATDGRAGTRSHWRGVATFRVLPVVPGRYELRFTRDRRNFATYRSRTAVTYRPRVRAQPAGGRLLKTAKPFVSMHTTT